jgi:hypothetical protein
MKWITLIFWLFFSSAYLYILSFGIPKDASINGFILFTAALAGGGLSYDIASKMFAIPSYRSHWKELIKRLLLIMLGHSMVLSGIFLAGFLNNIIGMIASSLTGFATALIGIVLSCHQAYKAEETFKKLRLTFSSL